MLKQCSFNYLGFSSHTNSTLSLCKIEDGGLCFGMVLLWDVNDTQVDFVALGLRSRLNPFGLASYGGKLRSRKASR